MTHKQLKLYGDRTSSLEFMLNKTEAKPVEAETGVTEFIGQDELSAAFPAMLTDAAFIDHALSALDASFQFSAMVVRIDKPVERNEETGHDFELDACMDLAEVIDAACSSENGMWGSLENEMFGCFFPGKSAARCLELAGTIRELLAKKRKETVSIGVAAYPTVNFGRDRILENARKALAHAEFFGPDSTVHFDAVSLNINGDKLYQGGDIETAMREFTTALMLDPSNVNVRNSLGVCYGILGDHDKAKEEFETAAWIDPEEVMPVYNIGLINMLEGNREKALEYFQQADGLIEDVFEVAFQIGRLYAEMGQPEKGKKFLEKATLLKPESGVAFRYLGECLNAMGMTDEAVSAYKKSVRQNPNDAESLSALGHLFEIQGENPEIAVTFCRQSVEISPDNGLFRHRLGRLYLKGDKLDDALIEFKKASSLGFDSTQYIEEIENRVLGN
ncbi:MAG: tetratricopeptide repeat protein [Pseudomonadota bacterium]